MGKNIGRDKVFAAPLATFVVSFMRRRILLVFIALLSVLSGCQGAAPLDRAEDARSLSSAGGSVGCENASVSFWGLDDPNRMQTWSSDMLRLGYGLPANASVFFVAYENDTIPGVIHVTTDEAVAANGVTFTLNTKLSGVHTINVKVYEDTNGNGDFNPNVDTACRHDGTEVQTGPTTLNFNKFNSSTPA